MHFIYECLSGENGALKADKELREDFFDIVSERAKQEISDEHDPEQAAIWYQLNEKFIVDDSELIKYKGDDA